MSNYLNLCRSCGRDFGGITAFDAHRVGNHDYLYDKKHPDGRRCLSVKEMKAKGFTKNKAGRWSTSKLLQAV